MRELTDFQWKALEVIKSAHKANPITGREIAERIALRDRDTKKKGADMRAVINAIRVKGFPVCASGDGYYYAQNQTELDEYIASLEGRIRKEEEALDGLKASRGYFSRAPRVAVETIHRDFKVDSNRLPGVSYTVSVHGERVTCTCEGFRRRQTCSHSGKKVAELKKISSQGSLLSP